MYRQLCHLFVCVRVSSRLQWNYFRCELSIFGVIAMSIKSYKAPGGDCSSQLAIWIQFFCTWLCLAPKMHQAALFALHNLSSGAANRSNGRVRAFVSLSLPLCIYVCFCSAADRVSRIRRSHACADRLFGLFSSAEALSHWPQMCSK